MDFLPTWPLHITPIIAFGFMLLIGAIGGYVAHRFSWLPSITGFMVVGLVCGPGGIGLLSQETINESRILVDIALALILYRLGLSLDIRHIAHAPGLLFTSLFESALTFAAVFFILHLFGTSQAIAALVAAIAISSSPAVLLHVAHEVGAKGEVTDSTKTLVALNNLISFIAFSATLPALHYSSGSNWIYMLLHPSYQLLGSLLLGLVLAYGLHTIATKTAKAAQYKLALVIGTLMITVGLANELKLSMLFAPLIIGIVVKSMEQESVVSDLEFGAAFELFFVVLFVFAGAGLHLRELVEYAPIVLALVLARTLAKTLGVVAISTALKKPLRTGIASGLLLIPMAGLAIGLVQTSATLFPQHAVVITAIIFGAVTVFETIGPPIATFAFRYAGESREIKQHSTAAEHTRETQ